MGGGGGERVDRKLHSLKHYLLPVGDVFKYVFSRQAKMFLDNDYQLYKLTILLFMCAY